MILNGTTIFDQVVEEVAVESAPNYVDVGYGPDGARAYVARPETTIHIRHASIGDSHGAQPQPPAEEGRSANVSPHPAGDEDSDYDGPSFW